MQEIAFWTQAQPASGNFREPLANRFQYVYVPSYEAPRGRTSVLICRGFINSRVGSPQPCGVDHTVLRTTRTEAPSRELDRSHPLPTGLTPM